MEVGWKAILGGTEVANAMDLSMSLSWCELTIHICEMGLAGHGDPPIPPRQDLRKESSPQMLSQGSLITRMIPTGGRGLYVPNSTGAALEGRLQHHLLSFPSPWP